MKIFEDRMEELLSREKVRQLPSDTEAIHREADEILMACLLNHNEARLVELYRQLEKWYS